MKWTSIISSILGRLWTRLFKDPDFIAVVENIFGSSGTTAEHKLSKFVDSKTVAGKQTYTGLTPVPVYLMIDTYKEYPPTVDTILGGYTQEPLDSGNAIWSHINSTTAIPACTYISSTPTCEGVWWIQGLNFKTSGTNLFFNNSLDFTDFDTTVVSLPPGEVKQCYKAYIWTEHKWALEQAMAFYGEEVSHVSDIIWDMHINGCTAYAAKAALAAVTDSSISPVSGTVYDIGTDCGYPYVIIDGKYIITGKPGQTCNTTVGASVEAGFVLFGGLVLKANRTINANDPFPGITVTTDVGEVFLENTVTDASVTTDGTVHRNILPVVASDSVKRAYVNRVAELSADPKCPTVELKTTAAGGINPFLYILRRFRGANGACIIVDYLNTAVEKVLAAIRKTSAASQVISVYIKVNVEAEARVTVGRATSSKVVQAAPANLNVTPGNTGYTSVL